MQSFPEAGGTDAGAGTGKEASKQHQSKMSGTLEREVEGWSYWCLGKSQQKVFENSSWNVCNQWSFQKIQMP